MSPRHENLKVYERSLLFSSTVATWLDTWDRRHAIVDQLDRASASITENIALASAMHTIAKSRHMDYAIGSTLECAACLDLAKIKQLLEDATANNQKSDLSELMRMLIGLKKRWSRPANTVEEEQATYSQRNSSILFRHEELDVYRVALDVATRFSHSHQCGGLPVPQFRRLDEPITSIVLNIAEGNGRFSLPDQKRFMSNVYEAAIRLTARIDIYIARGTLSKIEVDCIKEPLERVISMAAAMSAKRRD